MQLRRIKKHIIITFLAVSLTIVFPTMTSYSSLKETVSPQASKYVRSTSVNILVNCETLN